MKLETFLFRQRGIRVLFEWESLFIFSLGEGPLLLVLIEMKGIRFILASAFRTTFVDPDERRNRNAWAIDD